MQTYTSIANLLGTEAESLLEFDSPKISKELLHIPNPRHVDQVFGMSDRSLKVVRSLKRLYQHGRLGGTGYLSIFPVDQGVEHSAGASFAVNPVFFDPEQIVRFALEAECSGVASTIGVLGMVSKKYADKIPFIVKLNHNDLLRYPNESRQTMFASVEQAFELGAAAVGATIYFGSHDSAREVEEVTTAFAEAHRLGMATILWCYLRNDAFRVGKKDLHTAADLTGQANYLGATIGADIVKQKLPTLTGGYKMLNSGKKQFGKYDERMYRELSSEHPIDLARYQVLNSFAGRVSLINSGGVSGKNDLKDAVRSAVINKRAGGAGLILGRKAFQHTWDEGLQIIRAVQDVYLCQEISVV